MRCLLVALALIPSLLLGQAPDCNLARRAWDSPISDNGGMYLRRYQWHAGYAVAGVVIGETVHRTTRLPRWGAAMLTTAAISVLPHVRGIVRRQYPFNARDWAFDTLLRAAPLLLWDRPSKPLAATSLVAGYFALACFASP